ncbi:hypothetical protein [Streptomyces sp. NBC_01092]|uniref:hypothetical protein n=1 Tax=Streptomyces sp. NBC_01092 TaxID=2903748 RepID=UPI003869C1AE|nr:hypothetical protein OG254_03795 [Streptomyces sp. NBC_01092]
MGTSLTPEFWERFALLLFAATGVAFALAALFDSLALRRQNRRAHRPPIKSVKPTRAPHRPGTGDHRPSVHV